jgi:hypothetical protein
MAINYVQSTDPTITAGNAGTAYASGTQSTVFSYFSGTTGNLFVALVGVKPTSRQTTEPSIFTGTGGTAIGGTGTSTVDTGSTRMYFWHHTVDGTEPASDTLTWSVGSVSPVIMTLHEFSRTNPGAWSVAHAFGDDSAQSTGSGAIDITGNSDPGFAAGDLALVSISSPTDAGMFTNMVLSIPGCTVGALTPRADYGTTTGNDGGLQVWTAPINSGVSTGNPHLQGDVDDVNASAGPAVFVRLREPAGAGDTTAPSVPTGLAVDSFTHNSATLSWNASTDNVGVVGYKVYQDGVEVDDVTALTTTISGLAASTSYTYTISAYDTAANESAQSAGVITTTSAAPPAALTDTLVYDGTDWGNVQIQSFDGTIWN